MKKKKSLLRRISNVILAIVVFILAAVIALTVFCRITGNTPTLFGYSILRVSTGSMEPELMVGDVILTKEVDEVKSLAVGDVITYKGTIGEYADMLITHQIVKAPYDENGTTYVVTKGIANDIEDQPVPVDRIISKLVCKIPFLDALYGFFLTPWGLLSAVALIILAFAGEFWNIYQLSRAEKEDLPAVNQETLEKAIEQYKQDNTEDSKGETHPNDISDKTN